MQSPVCNTGPGARCPSIHVDPHLEAGNGLSQGGWQVSWLLWKMGQEAWAQGLCSAHYYRSPHQHHHSVWVVVPTASVNLEIILSALWHGPPWITAASEVDLLMGPPCPPTAENSHSGAGNHRLFLTGPGPAHYRSPRPQFPAHCAAALPTMSRPHAARSTALQGGPGEGAAARAAAPRRCRQERRPLGAHQGLRVRPRRR